MANGPSRMHWGCRYRYKPPIGPISGQYVQRTEQIGIFRTVERTEAIDGVDFVIGYAGSKRLGVIEIIQIGGIPAFGVQPRGTPGTPCEQAVPDDALVGGPGLVVRSCGV